MRGKQTRRIFTRMIEIEGQALGELVSESVSEGKGDFQRCYTSIKGEKNIAVASKNETGEAKHLPSTYMSTSTCPEI